jgi:hypothetical protein
MSVSDPLPSHLHQKLTGWIPSELGQLVALETLVLDANGYTGTIPSELGGLSQLLWLWLSENVCCVVKGVFLCVCSATSSPCTLAMIPPTGTDWPNSLRTWAALFFASD